MIAMNLNLSVHFLVLKYYHIILPPNNLLKDLFLRTNSYIETIENRGKISNNMFISVAICQPSSISFITRRILQRQNEVEDLSLPIINNTN